MIFLSVISILLIIAVFISLIKNDYWLFKVFEYPRLQKIVIVVLVLGGWSFYWPLPLLLYKLMVAALCACLVYLFYKVMPYTVISKKEMLPVKAGDKMNEIKIFAANVLQTNLQFDRMLQQITSCDPDVIFLLETNKAWEEGLKPLKKGYPYRLAQPQENTYGLLFYSRFEIEEDQINFLVKDDVPSIQAIVHLPSGQRVQIWGLHPEPPVPGENRYSTAKDKELMKVALQVKECKLPCFVFGDLNDVAWSYTTEMFRKTSGLLDPRRGRGFYSTFSAHHWFIRFPLDYIFCSEHFGLIEMKRMPKNGSDHFAAFTHLAFRPALKKVQEAPKADRKELAQATKLAEQPVKE